jgi:hypothetical protein
MFKVGFAFISIAVFLSAAACNGSNSPSPTAAVPVTKTTTSPLYTVSPTQNTVVIPEDADSRLVVPAGVVIYKGNLNGANLVPQVTLKFIDDTDTIYITYRDNIETAPGTIRNEIISVHDSIWKIRYNQIGPNSYSGDVSLTVEGLPSEIISEPNGPGFVFHISNDAKPGRYAFQINTVINLRSYPLPCTIIVR